MESTIAALTAMHIAQMQVTTQLLRWLIDHEMLAPKAAAAMFEEAAEQLATQPEHPISDHVGQLYLDLAAALAKPRE